MSIFAIITAVLVLGIVWGGMVFFLTRAMKFEKIKETNGEK